jgi:prophage antirepressor-like protein
VKGPPKSRKVPKWLKQAILDSLRKEGVLKTPVVKRALKRLAKPNPKKRARRRNPSWYIHIQKAARGPVMIFNGRSFTDKRQNDRPHPFASKAAALHKARTLLGQYHRALSPYKIWVSDRLFGQVEEASRANPHSQKLDQAAKKLEDFTGREATHVERARARSDERTGLVLGPLERVIYHAAREGIEGGATVRWDHKFRKNSRPLLAVSTDGKQLHVVGGQYEFTEAGIEDRG